jgi:hypothetical protein
MITLFQTLVEFERLHSLFYRPGWRNKLVLHRTSIKIKRSRIVFKSSLYKQPHYTWHTSETLI